MLDKIKKYRQHLMSGGVFLVCLLYFIYKKDPTASLVMGGALILVCCDVAFEIFSKEK